jgi:hypothetical protein
MLKFFLWLSFLRAMLKFSVQTFYQHLFSHTFPSAISLYSFPFQKLPTPKNPKQKPKPKTPSKANILKAKRPSSSFREEQGRDLAL